MFNCFISCNNGELAIALHSSTIARHGTALGCWHMYTLTPDISTAIWDHLALFNSTVCLFKLCSSVSGQEASAENAGHVQALTSSSGKLLAHIQAHTRELTHLSAAATHATVVYETLSPPMEAQLVGGLSSYPPSHQPRSRTCVPSCPVNETQVHRLYKNTNAQIESTHTHTHTHTATPCHNAVTSVSSRWRSPHTATAPWPSSQAYATLAQVCLRLVVAQVCLSGLHSY